jgi:anhydro-N-acetylmuramic acid kinase
MPTRWYIGLSTGSSLHGMDAALVRMEGVGGDLTPRMENFLHEPLGRDLRTLLLRATEPEGGVRQIGLAHRVLGETFANLARKLVDQSKPTWQQLLAIGLSGHTAWHETDGRFPTTLNLGMASAVAERTRLTVVSDFRSRDIMVGGQGYPLTGAIDAAVFRDAQERRALVQLGGVASVLWLPPGSGLRDLVAFQATPCTVLLDGLMRLSTGGRESFDPGGRHAVQGRCLEPLLERWLAHPFFSRKPPRSLPLSEFGIPFLTSALERLKQEGSGVHDLLCTATHFAARATADAIHRFLPARPDRVLVSGGGSRNGLLWRLLEERLAPIPMERTDRFGVPAEARKALGFAGLAALTMDGVPANIPASTGAGGPRLLGSITPGDGANWARCLSWMAGQTAHQRLAA